jgi:hypothetical protein
MANAARILTKNQNQLVPDKAIEKAMEGHTAIGTAFVDENGELVVQKQAAPFEAATFKQYQEEIKPHAIITVFQRLMAPINVAHVQPFVVEDEEKDGSLTTHVAIFVEGNLDKYALPKQPQTAEAQWFHKTFEPLVTAYGDTTKEPTIAGFMDYLRLPDVKGALEASLEGRGCIKVLSETGEIMTFTSGDAAFKADWGEVSNGYTEGTFPAKEESAAKGKVKSLFGGKGTITPKAQEPAPTPPKEEPKKDDDKTVIHQPPAEKKTDTAVAVIGADPQPPEGKVWARPVAKIRNHNKTLKKKVQGMLGGLPQGWPTMQWFAVDKAKLPHRDWEIKGETAISSALEKAKNGDENRVTPEDMRKGLMPPQMQKDLMDKFLPSVAKYTETPNLPTMEELQADENKHPTWYDKTGIHVQNTLGWPPEKVAELDRDYHAAFVLRQKAITSMLVKMIHEHPPAKKEDQEPEIVPEKTGTTEEEKRKNLANLNKDLTAKKGRSLFRKSA